MSTDNSSSAPTVDQITQSAKGLFNDFISEEGYTRVQSLPATDPSTTQAANKAYYDGYCKALDFATEGPDLTTRLSEASTAHDKALTQCALRAPTTNDWYFLGYTALVEERLWSDAVCENPSRLPALFHRLQTLMDGSAISRLTDQGHFQRYQDRLKSIEAQLADTPLPSIERPD